MMGDNMNIFELIQVYSYIYLETETNPILFITKIEL